jgi:hypothetical protein
MSEKGVPEQWEANIQISSTRYFNHFSFLNHKKRTYLAYDNTVTGKDRLLVKQLIPDQSVARHGRNQLTKSFLFLIVKMASEGT